MRFDRTGWHRGHGVSPDLFLDQARRYQPAFDLGQWFGSSCLHQSQLDAHPASTLRLR
jgi:hypothetical protein